MRFNKSASGSLLLTLLLSIFAGQAASAQPIWLSPEPEPGISLEVLKTRFDDGTFVVPNFGSSLWFLSARLPLGRGVHALVDLPVSAFDGKYRNYWNSYYGGPEYAELPNESSVGNPFVGLEVQDRQRMWYGLFGVRLPLIGDENSLAKEYAIVTDVDRADAFMDDVTPISIRFGVRSPKGSGPAFHAFAGPTIWLVGGEGINNDNEVFLNYGAQMWVRSDIARIGGGVTGRYWVSLHDASFGERTVHQFGFAANVGSGAIRPGVHFRVPLDEDWDFTGVEFIYGLNLTVLLGDNNSD